MAGNILREKIRAGARIIDVRTPAEYRDDAYPGAVNIPLPMLPLRLGELEPKDKPVVLYCESGARSSQAVRLLKQAGFTDVINAGGLADMPK
jgi:phage shock protein E